MQVKTPNTSSYSKLEIGKIQELSQYSFKLPGRSEAIRGKRFLKEALDMTGMEISIHRAEKGAAMPMLHRHERNEEVYLFLSGSGQFQVAGETFLVGEGSAIRVAASEPRAWRNTGEVPLVYLCVQAPQGGCEASTISDGRPVAEALVWPDQAS